MAWVQPLWRSDGSPPSSGQSHDGSEKYDKNDPYRVLGIAFVVDQAGKGARMVLRYPSAPLGSIHGGAEEDIFFRLPPRQMAKLFRPKPDLCGQPMTLSVGGTVFCCSAVLMGDSNLNESPTGDAEQNDLPLSLFSLIVALVPNEPAASILFAGWMESASAAAAAAERTGSQPVPRTDGRASTSDKNLSQKELSPSFLSVRRVHVSLSRLCRILEREERRCRYVTVQCSLFSKIRGDLQKKWRAQMKASAAATKPSSSSSSIASPASIASKTSQTNTDRSTGGRHRRQGSFPNMAFDRDASGTTEARPNVNEEGDGIDLMGEFQHEYLDIIMAAQTTDQLGALEHQGNLARELVQFYHALARNDHQFTPTPASLLSGREGIVYVNRHIATVIEAVSPSRALSYNTVALPSVRSYHSLLFPHATPSQLLESLAASGSSTPKRRLQQLLRAVSPQKTLADIAVDANLPLDAVLEIASYMVEQGACMPSPVLSSSCRLACRSVEMIRDVSLPFTQLFGHAINLLVLVSYVTSSGRTLGETIVALSTSSDSIALLVRARLEASLSSNTPNHHSFIRPTIPSTGATLRDDSEGRSIPTSRDHVEELFYQMTVWLCATRVLVPMREYLVHAKEGPSSAGSAMAHDGGEARMQEEVKSERRTGEAYYHRTDRITDDALFRALQEAGCLEGKVSIQASSWRIGVEAAQIRAFARHSEIRIISRVPMPGDDWDSW